MYAFKIMLDNGPLMERESESRYIYLTEEEAINEAEELINTTLSSKYGRHYLDFDVIIYSTD